MKFTNLIIYSILNPYIILLNPGLIIFLSTNVSYTPALSYLSTNLQATVLLFVYINDTGLAPVCP